MHHLGNDLARDFASVFDALETSIAEVTRERGFYPVQAAFSLLVEQMDRIVRFDPMSTMSTPARSIEPHASRAKYAPVREDLLALFSAVKNDLSRPWTVEEMAHVAHLSPRHLTRVFLDAMGRTPRAAVSAMRAKEMCRLLRETDVTIEQAGHIVPDDEPAYRQELPKTQAGYRTIPLTQSAVGAVLMQLTQLHLQYGPELDGDLLIFGTRKNSPDTNFGRAFREIRKAAGILDANGNTTREEASHTYRRTLATKIARELDSDSAAAFVGHAAAGITVRSYIQRTTKVPASIARAIEAERKKP